MKNFKNLFILAASVLTLAGCGSATSSASGTSSAAANLGTIRVCASELPHYDVLNEAVKPLIEAKGYKLEVTVLDWTLQNDGVYNGDYDANYFQHRPYLECYDSGANPDFDDNYAYTKVFPTATVHFEPLSIYPSKKKASEFESSKTTATYCVCNDSSNCIRALDLLKANGVINDYTTDEAGNPIDTFDNITFIAEEMLANSLADYDYGVLPVNTALTANLTRDTSLPTEGDEMANKRANVLAASVSKYGSDTDYKAKIDALTDCILDKSVETYITTKYNGVIKPYLKDLRK